MHRVKNIFNNSEKIVDCILLKNASAPFVDDNFFYVTGLEQGLFEGSCAVLRSDGALDILVSELEAEGARKSTAHLIIYKSKDEYVTALKHLMPSYQTIGVNASGLSYRELTRLTETFPQTTFVDVSEAFFKTRLIKDEQEIHHLKQACKIADDTMAALPDLISLGMSENELAAEINYSLQSLGAEKPAFDTISSFGKNTAEPHYGHGDVKLEKGNLVLCDFGACFKKYNSDITRTAVFGRANTQQKEMYETVLQAQQIAFDAIKPGVIAGDVHNAVSSFIDATKFKGRFIHSTGHSLGLAVHDGVGFSPDSTMVLKENMILTVEPGIYIPGFGGVRIEDDVLIKKDGLELLTKSSRALTEFD
ncbi:MAG TPA: aminopeptidase P family protein [Thermoplasmata archaeon]|jgi:Xaa-Pro dipeptidase|nr:MAG TPA: aminopeptidase P family protein [Thermoplasmata archaeon]